MGWQSEALLGVDEHSSDSKIGRDDFLLLFFPGKVFIFVQAPILFFGCLTFDFF